MQNYADPHLIAMKINKTTKKGIKRIEKKKLTSEHKSKSFS